MTFEEWWKENAVDLNESYSKQDMEWIAEMAWDARGLNGELDLGIKPDQEEPCEYCGEPSTSIFFGMKTEHICSNELCAEKADEKAIDNLRGKIANQEQKDSTRHKK